MVIKIKNCARGSALAIVLFVLVIMLLLAVTLNQIMIGQLRAVNNSNDVLLAQNYARLALLNAEATVYNFDIARGFEANSVDSRNTILTAAMPASDSCNASGWCYKSIAYGSIRNSDPAWQPWTLSESGSLSDFPCSSYTVSKNGTKNSLPLIDKKLTTAPVYDTGDSSLCAQPRYIMEPLQLDFRGQIAAGQVDPVQGLIAQNNRTSIRTFQSNDAGQRSARVYRITVRAFGKNGDTRVTLQETVAIMQNSQNRNVGDTVNIPAHNIIPLSVRWLN